MADTGLVEYPIYAVMCIDDNTVGTAEGTPRGGSVKRMENYPEHKEYQAATSDPLEGGFIKKLSAGPVTNDDDTMMVGSCFLLQCNREQAEAFVQNDPFYKKGVWSQTHIHRYSPVFGIREYVKPVPVA